ncbi:uncharacterized protein LOC135218105 [Macrobrachium nipponense]|uniref:uncharacterized protein LOC135218105 n=1 Tax=Macrobrachium nipponense TaxID=159736 RepID=UPI0030C7BB68
MGPTYLLLSVHNLFGIDLEGPGDDEVTTLSHIDILKAECQKESPDLAMIARKMERTFAFRWKKINNPNLSVEDILLDFPALRERNFLAGEAERHGIFKPLWNTYLKLQTSLVELMKYAKLRSKNYKRHYSEYQEGMDSTLDEDQRTDLCARFALQLLPSLFKENEEYLLVHSQEDIKSPAPVLTFQGGDYQLHINGSSVFSRKNSKFTNAFESMFQSYFVFSLEYPKPIEKTLLFLESYIFQHNCKLPSCVCTWAEKIGMGA